jgi:hypothetical protein
MERSSNPPQSLPNSPSIPDQTVKNRSEDMSQIEGLPGQTTKAEDAAKESTPGNRKPIGMDGIDTTK